MTGQLVIPAHINSLANYIEETFKKYNSKPAYNALDQTVSFAEIARLSAQFGA